MAKRPKADELVKNNLMELFKINFWIVMLSLIFCITPNLKKISMHKHTKKLKSANWIAMYILSFILIFFVDHFVFLLTYELLFLQENILLRIP